MVNSTVNLSSAHYVPTPQVVLGNKANEHEQTLNNALKSAEKNFGIPQDQSEPQWVKDLNKSETSTVANETNTSAAQNAFMSTYGSFLRNLNPFGSREHHVNGVKNCNYQLAKSNVNRVENVGSLLNSTELSKLTTEQPIQSQFMMNY